LSKFRLELLQKTSWARTKVKNLYSKLKEYI